MDRKDNKLQRLLEPGFRFYFIVLFLFAAVCLVISIIFPHLNLFPWVAIFQALLYLFLLLAYLISNERKKSAIIKYINSATSTAESFSSGSVFSYPLPMAVVRLESGEIIWYNSSFEKFKNTSSVFFEMNIADIAPDFDLHWLMDGKTECPYDVTVDERMYTVYGNIVRSEGSSLRGLMGHLTWLDITETRSMQNTLTEKNVLVAEIVWDNYDEAIKNASDVNRSLMNASLNEKLHLWVQPTQGVLRRIERNSYLLFFEEKHLTVLSSGKFSIIESARGIKSDNGLPVTLSIGIGKGGKSLAENEKFSHLAIDMALSRGGSQVVIRNNLSFDFYGGHNAEFEKRTKVKSRVMANVLGGLIHDSSNIIVMGHKYGDIDSLGAAAGIVCAARKYGKNVYIVLDMEKNSAKPLINLLMTDDYYNDVFISAETAMIISNSSSLLVVVDTNRPAIVESASLLESFNHIAVIDHHRRAAEYIENAEINIHEPSASSTCEIISEILQYIIDLPDIHRVESIALLAGIFLDSKNFTVKTGVRTFEAAAYLRMCGAETLEIKQLFQNEFERYVQRSDLVKSAFFYREKFAIIFSQDTVEQVTASQAADEMLNISGIQASFIIYPASNHIYISARSLGRVNVQIILEKLGGGGHYSTAAAQVHGKSLDDVRIELTNSIDSYISDEN